MSSVAEIREAIDQLSEKDRYLLLAELFAAAPAPDENDPQFLAALDEAEEDIKAGRVYSVDEARALIPQWISKSSSPSAP